MQFVMYGGTAIYSPAVEEVMHEFGVGYTEAVLGFGIYAIGYGVGPLVSSYRATFACSNGLFRTSSIRRQFLSPLAELPKFGRNPLYVISLFLFCVASVPCALAKDWSTLMGLRFLTGVLSSPVIGHGGATLSDIYNEQEVAYGM